MRNKMSLVNTADWFLLQLQMWFTFKILGCRNKYWCLRRQMTAIHEVNELFDKAGEIEARNYLAVPVIGDKLSKYRILISYCPIWRYLYEIIGMQKGISRLCVICDKSSRYLIDFLLKMFENVSQDKSPILGGIRSPCRSRLQSSQSSNLFYFDKKTRQMWKNQACRPLSIAKLLAYCSQYLSVFNFQYNDFSDTSSF